MRRNGMSAAQVQAIMATQATRAARLAAADDVIANDGDPAALVPQVERLHAFYLARVKHRLSRRARVCNFAVLRSESCKSGAGQLGQLGQPLRNAL